MSIEDLKVARALLDKAITELSAIPKWRTDRRVEPLKPLTLAPVMVDPSFGTTIRRVTSDDGRSYRTQSSGNSWAADSRHFVVTSTSGSVYLYQWDKKAATRLTQLTGFATDVSFDRDATTVCYGGAYRNDEAIIRQFGLISGAYSDLIGVRELVPDVDANGRTYLRGLSVASGKLSFIFGGQSQDYDHYVYVAPLSSLKGLLMDSVARLGCHLHACSIDLSGRYLALGTTAADIDKGHPMNYIWDTQTDTVTPMKVSAGGHGAIGYGQSVNNPDDADGMQYLLRSLAAPDVVTELVQPYPVPPAFQMASHLTYCKARNSVISATYRYGSGVAAPWREWDDEIIEVPIAGGPILRYCHHRSSISNGTDFRYWATPKPAISPDGSAILFTSNFNRELGSDSEGPREDVFLVTV